jgi:ABC-type transport system involved in multi-copper enzyme maturation permease subunit
MNAQSLALEADAVRSPVRGGMFLGFGTFLRKEIADWVRGRRALVVGGVVTAAAAFTTVIPFVVAASGESSGVPLSMDPTANVLLGWGGQTMPIVALLASMALLSGERDRGTLAWSLTRPLSPTSILAAKWLAAVGVLAIVAIVVPLTVSVVIASIAYGALPDLGTVGLFAVLYASVPAFYVALTLALGTAVKGAGGIAGIGFLVMFLPSLIGSLVPIVAEAAPTAIGGWAMAVATGQPASTLTLAGFVGSMAILVVAGKVVFDRQEV